MEFLEKLAHLPIGEFWLPPRMIEYVVIMVIKSFPFMNALSLLWVFVSSLLSLRRKSWSIRWWIFCNLKLSAKDMWRFTSTCENIWKEILLWPFYFIYSYVAIVLYLGGILDGWFSWNRLRTTFGLFLSFNLLKLMPHYVPLGIMCWVVSQVLEWDSFSYGKQCVCI